MTRVITGVSEEAQYVAQISREHQQHWDGSAIFSKQPAYNELWDLWNDCREFNWDCQGALPVGHDTYQNAYLFIEALPLGYTLPDIGAEPDGHITLEWYHHPRWVLSISVTPDDTIYYAALFGLSDSRGSESFNGEISENIHNLIRRVAGK